MASRNGISRRRALALSAAGGLAVASGMRASAQAVKRIDTFAAGLDSVISTSEPILELGTGTGEPQDVSVYQFSSNVLVDENGIGLALGVEMIIVIALIMVGYAVLQRRAGRWLQ